MNRLMLIVVAFAVFEVKCRPAYESVSLDTPEVQLDNILDAKVCLRNVGLKRLPSSQNTDREGLIPENNEQLNSYYGCIYQRKGIVDADGIVNVYSLRAYLANLFTMNQAITLEQKILIDDCINLCKDVQGNDHGDKSVKLQNCILQRMYDLVKE